MAVKLSPVFQDAQLDSNGNPLSGGKLYTYAAGTTTNQATYTTSAGSVQQANPIILNSRGEPDNPIWLTEGLSYKFVLKTSADATIRTVDNVSGVNDTASTTFDQWTTPSVTSLTYVSASTFTVAGDQTSTFHAGRRVKATVTAGTIYGTIQSSTFGASTTVVVGWDSTALDSGLSTVQVGILTATNHSIPSAALPFPANFRNKIIGGDFTTNPWQRGTTFTAPAVAAYVADRWQLGIAGTSAVVDVYKLLDAPTAAQAGIYTQYSMHFDVTTADAAMAAGDVYNFQQKIEGINAAVFGFGQSGTRYATLSFWVKAAKTGIHCVALQNGASDRSYVKEYTISVANTWEYKTLTFPVDTTGTWLYAAGTIGVRVVFPLACGSNYQTTADTWAAGGYQATSGIVNELDNTANNFKIALVQFEPGQVATPFEQRDYGTELKLCRRYLPAVFSSDTTSTIGLGQCYSTTAAAVYVPFEVEAMTKPTGATVSNAAHITLTQAAYTTSAGTGISFDGRSSKHGGLLLVTGASGLTAGDATHATFNNASGYVLFTGCEL